MSDEEFLVASLPFFNQQTWTLHDGICLLSKMDPAQKEPKVGRLPEEKDCPTNRLYKQSLEAINFYKDDGSEVYFVEPLRPLKEFPNAVDATGVLVNPRIFVKWTLDSWPNQSSHMKVAEKQCQIRKAGKKAHHGKELWRKSLANKEENHAKAKATFWAMVKDQNISVKTKKFSYIKLAEMLETELKKTVQNPYGWEQFRRFVSTWIKEYLNSDEYLKK